MKPPIPEDAERALLGTLADASLLDAPGALQALEATRLSESDFGVQAHAEVYLAALEALRRGAAVELLAMQAVLQGSFAVKAMGPGWLARVLTGAVALGPSSVAENARVVREAGVKRRLFGILREAAESLCRPTVTAEEAMARAQAAVASLSARSTALDTAQGDLFRLLEALEASQAGKRRMVLPTRIRALDAAMGGLQPAVLTLVGALPGVGKSALLATMAYNLARAGTRVGFFSLEDESLWLTRRWLAQASGVPVFALATRPLAQHEMAKVEGACEGVHGALSHLVVDDRPALTPDEVVATAGDMVLNRGAQALVVDHLGEIQVPRSERYDLEVAAALSALRDIAKRHNLPVVVASHVRRRNGLDVCDEPSLTDFANSAACERMARVALGLSQPKDVPDTLRVTVLKQTNGPSGFAFDLELDKRAGMVATSVQLKAVSGTEEPQ